MTDGVVFNGSSLINGSTVSIPLKTDATTFSFILNSGSTNPALVNEDILKFNYAREELLYLERVVLKQNIHSILELRMSLLMLQ
jgi:ribonucleotide monophosphatase NagD (HAD superfamily)